MKDLKVYLALLCATLLLFSSCAKEQEAPQSYSIDFAQKKVTLTKGQEVLLAVKTEPEQISQKLIWTSQDPTIVTVSEKGLAKGLQAGNTIVTVQIEGTDAKASCLVSVSSSSSGQDLTVTITPSSALLAPGEQVQLAATIDPASEEHTIEWIAEKPDVASVDEHGLVTAKALGETIVLARIKGSNVTASCLIEVRQQAQVQLSAEIAHKLKPGYSLTLSAAIASGESLLVDDGSGERKEYAVSSNASNPTMLDISVRGTTVKLYGAPLSYLSLASNKAVERISIPQPDMLKVLNLQDNQLKALDLSAFSALEELSIGGNSFEGKLSINLPKLKMLRLDHNKLTALELHTPALESLYADHLALTALALPATMSHLKLLEVHHNKLSKDATKTLVTSLPKLTGQPGKCIILNTELPTPEGNQLDKNSVIPLAQSRGWALYDGRVEIKAETIQKDPQGLNIKDVAYLDWSKGSKETITTWEMAQGATYDTGASDTEDPDYLQLAFKGKAGGDVFKRVYIIEEGKLVQVEVFVKPLDRVLVQESGAKQRLNKNFLDSLKANGYTTPQERSPNQFMSDNATLHSKVLIYEEIEHGIKAAKLTYSQKR